MFADAVFFCAVWLPLVPFLGVLAMAIGLVVAAFVHSAVLARSRGSYRSASGARVRFPVLLWVIATAVAWVCAETAGPLIVRTIVSAGVAFVLFLTLLLPTHREPHEALTFARAWLRRHLARGSRTSRSRSRQSTGTSSMKSDQRRRRHRLPLRTRASAEDRPAPASAPISSSSETVTIR